MNPEVLRRWSKRGGAHGALTEFRWICRAQEGFGESRPKKNVHDRKKRTATKKTVKQIYRSLQRGNTRPIDPKEAAEGRLDYATLKNWGAGRENAKLEDLEVQSFRSDVTHDPDLPFHNRLARTLEFLQSAGELSVGAENLRRFEEWEFEEDRYGTVIANLARGHRAVEKAIAEVLDSFTHANHIGDFEMEALYYVSSKRWLDRGACLMRDFENFVRNSPGLEDQDIGAEDAVEKYETYVKQLTKDVIEGDSSEKQIEALCKILAHVYILRIMHFTSGTRIAAVAVEKLQLIAKNAASAYKTYPTEISDPLGMFVQDINSIGQMISEPHKQMVFVELPEAFNQTSVFYEPLAREYIQTISVEK